LMESEGTLYYFITYARKYGVNWRWKTLERMVIWRKYHKKLW
jgi:hypothetical protein